MPESRAAFIAVPETTCPLTTMPSIAIVQKAGEMTVFHELVQRVSSRPLNISSSRPHSHFTSER